MGRTDRLPPWFRGLRSPLSPDTVAVRAVLERLCINTVCQDARCPNLGRCFTEGTAAFMILGRTCTRDCRFCAVAHGRPESVDAAEPDRLAAAVSELGLRHAVVTSVTRDDLPDGGAGQFAAVIAALRRTCPGTTIEVLTPDFSGREHSVSVVAAAGPDVFNHNVETVPRLYPTVRPGADYARSLRLLATVKRKAPAIRTKSGLMLGLGECEDEVEAVLRDLRRAGCDMVTIGQYLRPTRAHLPVVDYIRPEKFAAWAEEARRLGFAHAAAGPLIRSSYQAGAHLAEWTGSPDEGIK